MELSAAVETVAVRSRFATLYSSLVDEGEFWGETDIGWLAEVRVAPPTHEDKSAAEEESVGMSSLHTFSQDLGSPSSIMPREVVRDEAGENDSDVDTDVQEWTQDLSPTASTARHGRSAQEPALAVEVNSATARGKQGADRERPPTSVISRQALVETTSSMEVGEGLEFARVVEQPVASSDAIISTSQWDRSKGRRNVAVGTSRGVVSSTRAARGLRFLGDLVGSTAEAVGTGIVADRTNEPSTLAAEERSRSPAVRNAPTSSSPSIARRKRRRAAGNAGYSSSGEDKPACPHPPSSVGGDRAHVRRSPHSKHLTPDTKRHDTAVPDRVADSTACGKGGGPTIAAGASSYDAFGRIVVVTSTSSSSGEPLGMQGSAVEPRGGSLDSSIGASVVGIEVKRPSLGPEGGKKIGPRLLRVRLERERRRSAAGASAARAARAVQSKQGEEVPPPLCPTNEIAGGAQAGGGEGCKNVEADVVQEEDNLRVEKKRTSLEPISRPRYELRSDRQRNRSNNSYDPKRMKAPSRIRVSDVVYNSERERADAGDCLPDNIQASCRGPTVSSNNSGKRWNFGKGSLAIEDNQGMRRRKNLNDAPADGGPCTRRARVSDGYNSERSGEGSKDVTCMDERGRCSGDETEGTRPSGSSVKSLGRRWRPDRDDRPDDNSRAESPGRPAIRASHEDESFSWSELEGDRPTRFTTPRRPFDNDRNSSASSARHRAIWRHDGFTLGLPSEESGSNGSGSSASGECWVVTAHEGRVEGSLTTQTVASLGRAPDTKSPRQKRRAEQSSVMALPSLPDHKRNRSAVVSSQGLASLPEVTCDLGVRAAASADDCEPGSGSAEAIVGRSGLNEPETFRAFDYEHGKMLSAQGQWARNGVLIPSSPMVAWWEKGFTGQAQSSGSMDSIGKARSYGFGYEMFNRTLEEEREVDKKSVGLSRVFLRTIGKRASVGLVGGPNGELISPPPRFLRDDSLP